MATRVEQGDSARLGDPHGSVDRLVENVSSDRQSDGSGNGRSVSDGAEMRGDWIYGRGVCPWCRRERQLTTTNHIRAHACPQHPIGYTQGGDVPERVLEPTVKRLQAVSPSPERPKR